MTFIEVLGGVGGFFFSGDVVGWVGLVIDYVREVSSEGDKAGVAD